MKNTIYYFTGTGNSLQIAKYLKDRLPDTRLIRVCKKNLTITEDTQSDRIGFVFPVYYRGLPQMLFQFLKHLKVSPHTYFFAVSTYGSYPALTLEQIDELLKKKGARLSGAFGVDMPGNMWFMYYPHSKKDYTDRLAVQEEKAADIAEKIKANEITSLPEIPNHEAEERYYEKIQHINESDQGFYTSEHCIGCGICAKVCPAENIRLEDNRPIWLHHCEYCLACMHWCPQAAIEFEDVTKGKDRYHNPCIKLKELFD